MNSITEHLPFFEHFLKSNQIITCKSDLSKYGTDRTNHFKPNPLLVLFPISTNEVSKIVKYCNDQNIAIVPSAGRTGLSGGAVAQNQEIVISVEKMNKILKIDTVGATIQVESGVILENIQNLVDETSLYFPLDFAAKGSCMVGGFISTNAGGVKVLKYGMTREHVLGLEVVLASGEVLNLDYSLVKDNSGYDLKQFFIGAEGTLGIITKATFKCLPKPKNKELLFLSTDKFTHVPKILSFMKNAHLDILAFEYIDSYSLKSTLNAMPHLKFPFNSRNSHTILTEVDEPSREKIELLLENLADSQLIIDASISENSSQFNDYWVVREAVSDSIYLNGSVHANDISVPIKSLSAFLAELEMILNKHYTQFSVGIFGHIGDGNLHIYIVNKPNIDFIDYSKLMKLLDKQMFELVRKFDGSISAEHGIGLLKKEALSFRRSDLELLIMTKIKNVFDPNGIMNPGKII
jgi:glycolate oxidase subunit GlcD